MRSDMGRVNWRLGCARLILLSRRVHNFLPSRSLSV